MIHLMVCALEGVGARAGWDSALQLVPVCLDHSVVFSFSQDSAWLFCQTSPCSCFHKSRLEMVSLGSAEDAENPQRTHAFPQQRDPHPG